MVPPVDMGFLCQKNVRVELSTDNTHGEKNEIRKGTGGRANNLNGHFSVWHVGTTTTVQDISERYKGESEVVKDGETTGMQVGR